jgi:hypothetical protein
VDPSAKSKVTLQAGIENRELLQHPTLGAGSRVRGSVDSDFGEEDFMICPTSITVYSLDNQEWCNIGVAHLKPKEWRPAAFDRLVLDQEKKDTLSRLVKTNSLRVQSKKSVDIVEGKGQGIVLLLHGPPGVGKTVCSNKSNLVSMLITNNVSS